MKIIKIVASFLLILGISVLVIWAGMKTKKQICTDISIVIHAGKDSKLLIESNILNILKRKNIKWEGKTEEEIELPAIKKILAEESYIKSVDNVYLSGTNLQIEITLYDILLKAEPEKFLLDVDGISLPYSPNAGSDVIVAKGFISSKDELFYIASLIKKDPFYDALFRELEINNKQEITLFPTVENTKVLFGTIQNAENKFKILKYMYKDVLPYMSENKYAQLDVRFQNRIIAKKTKS